MARPVTVYYSTDELGSYTAKTIRTYGRLADLEAGDLARVEAADTSYELTEEVAGTDPETGEPITVTQRVPYHRCYWTADMDAPRLATQAEIDARTAAAAQAEADRIAALATDHGVEVGMLASLLDVYGMAIPTTEQAVKEKVKELSVAGTLTADQTALIGTIKTVFADVLSVMAYEDIGDVWLAINAGGE